MTVTAETITDEQISDLWKQAQRDLDADTIHTCNAARNTFGDYTPEYQRECRARCAEIWNARQGSTP